MPTRNVVPAFPLRHAGAGLGESAQLAGGAAGRPNARPRLIIADDDFVIQTLMSASLERDFEVVGVAGDAEEAIALARAQQPDVALVDVEMPKGGGSRAVAGMIEVAPKVAIVVLSGDESDAVVRELISAGAVAYTRKGIDPQELAELLIGSIEVRSKELARVAPPGSLTSAA
jgi:DNA-binding NarL/FixJ family response regulator